MQQARGTLTPQAAGEACDVAAPGMSIDKRFHGDLEATRTGRTMSRVRNGWA